MTVRPSTQHNIQRDDENITQLGQAVVRKIIVSGSLSMLSSGIDTGTGDVTLIVTGTPSTFDLASTITNAISKNPPVGPDSFPINDTEDSNSLKRVTLTNARTFFKATYDTLYAALANGVTNGNSHDHVGGDGATLTVPTLLSAHGLLTTIAASTTSYIAPGTTTFTTPSISNSLVTVAGTLKNFYVRIGTAQPGSGTFVFTVFVNNVATALTMTVPINGAAGNYSDTTHSVAIVAGDRISFECKNNATGASAQVGSVVVEFDVNNV